MTPLLHKLMSSGLWASSLTMLIAGTLQGDGNEERWLSWSLFLALGACVFTGWLIVEYVVERESRRATVCIAKAVGRAVGEHLQERETTRIH